MLSLQLATASTSPQDKYNKPKIVRASRIGCPYYFVCSCDVMTYKRATTPAVAPQKFKTYLMRIDILFLLNQLYFRKFYTLRIYGNLSIAIEIISCFF